MNVGDTSLPDLPVEVILQILTYYIAVIRDSTDYTSKYQLLNWFTNAASLAKITFLHTLKCLPIYLRLEKALLEKIDQKKRYHLEESQLRKQRGQVCMILLSVLCSTYPYA